MKKVHFGNRLTPPQYRLFNEYVNGDSRNWPEMEEKRQAILKSRPMKTNLKEWLKSEGNPETVTLYRGFKGDFYESDSHFSWTRDKEVAKQCRKLAILTVPVEYLEEWFIWAVEDRLDGSGYQESEVMIDGETLMIDLEDAWITFE